MIVLPLAATTFVWKFFSVLFFIVAIGLVLLILIQKGKGGGLSAALGGGAASSVLGSKTADFLTWVTIVMAAVFLLLAVIMGLVNPLETKLQDTGPAAVSPAPVRSQVPAESAETSGTSGQVPTSPGEGEPEQ